MNTPNESTSSVEGWPLRDVASALSNDASKRRQNSNMQQKQISKCNEKLDRLQELRNSISGNCNKAANDQSRTCSDVTPAAEAPQSPVISVPPVVIKAVGVPEAGEQQHALPQSTGKNPQAAIDSFAEQQSELRQVQLARLEAARRRRENHDRQQQLTSSTSSETEEKPCTATTNSQNPVGQESSDETESPATNKTTPVVDSPTNNPQVAQNIQPANQSPIESVAPSQSSSSQQPQTPPVQQAQAPQKVPAQQQTPAQQHAQAEVAPQTHTASTPESNAEAQNTTIQNTQPRTQAGPGLNDPNVPHPAQTFAGYPQQYPNQHQNNLPQYYPQPMPPGQVPFYPNAQHGYPNAGPAQPYGMGPVQPIRRDLQTDVATEDVEEFFEQQYAEDSLPERQDAFAKTDMQFRNCLMDNLREGIIFIDSYARVTCWNQSVEVMTGMTTSSMMGFELTPSKLSLSTLEGQPVGDVNCPMQKAMESRTDVSHNFVIRGRSGRESKIEMSIAPVVNGDQVLGAVIVMHDNSIQYELERQVKDLHMLSVRDPLTQVANRAEFERLLDEYVRMHRATRTNCCIIVCDIDFFKQVNDTYGHHIGDQALISFARMLQKYVRARDVVARYGGEEFVILCANCNLESAVGRAEEIRMALNKTPQQMLNGKTISASFGVSQLLDEESTTDFFIRADQALYKAKEGGRNRVVRATNDATDGEANDEAVSSSRELSKISGLTWRKIKSKLLFTEEFVSRTAQGMLVSKLRGFIHEKNARILKCEADLISMIVRTADSSRSQDFRMDIELQPSPNKNANETHMRIVIFTPQRRLFRGTNDDLHQRLVLDIRQYLMINDEGSHVQLNTFAESSDR